MVKYAEAECATCSAIRPKSDMRQVRVKRLASVSHGSSSSSGTSYSRSKNSNSSKSSRNTRRNYKIQDVWVCKGCRAPKSDKDGLGVWGWVGGAAVVLLMIASQRGEDSNPSAIRDTAQEADFLSGSEKKDPTNTAMAIPESPKGPVEEEADDSQIVFESSPVIQPFEGGSPAPADSLRAPTTSITPKYDCSAVTEAGRANLEYLKGIGCESIYEGATE